MMHTREEEVEMMQSPDRWPMWPRLPIIGPKGAACLLEFGMGGVKPVVYHLNLFEDFSESVEKTEFESFEAIVDSGWRVD